MKAYTLILAAAWTLAPLAGQAAEPLGAATLERYCEVYDTEPDSVYAIKCMAYVGGFIDGALATDERVAEDIAGQADSSESFAERATRTRTYGRLRAPSGDAQFCVGQQVSLPEIVSHVVYELKSREQVEEVAAQQILYATLRKHYPCA